MQVLFQKLLGRSDGWNQTQKEAMIDLCLLGMYSDDLTSLAEQDFIEDESTHLKWESGISFSGYLQRTVPKIRLAKGDSQKMEDVLQDIGDRLGSDELKRKACNELQKLLATDEVVKVEEEFLSKVQRVMGI
jgi:hypothetical protein